jgi:serine/threonine protein kinase
MPKKCGNLAFYAPEKLMGGDIYDRFALDYWNTGIILYSL